MFKPQNEKETWRKEKRNANIRVNGLWAKSIEIAHFRIEKNFKFAEKNLKKHLHYF